MTMQGARALVLGGLIVMTLAPASTASAQSLKMPTLVFAGAASADWVTTYQAQQRGTQENNPLLSWLNTRPGPLVATGAALDVAGLWAWNRYVGRAHPKIAMAGLYAAAGFRLWLATNNNRLNRTCYRVAIPLACP